MEEWREIEGFPNYQISSHGRVKSLQNNKERILSTYIRNNYLSVILYKEGKQKHKDIHRLLADAFIPKNIDKLEVDHINRNKLDNRLDNLRWSDRQEQCINKDDWFKGTNTGEPYISFDKSRNRFQIRKRIQGVNYYKVANTLDDAIKIRDTLLTS
jgi:hypothetical protein